MNSTTRAITWPHATHLGFDKFFTELDQAITQGVTASNAFPRHNIVKIDETKFRIELALAGYNREDLTVVVEKGRLIVSCDKSWAGKDEDYLHRGISAKKFVRKFQLKENVEVSGSSFVDGLLMITLEHIVPEEDAPKVIDIQ